MFESLENLGRMFIVNSQGGSSYERIYSEQRSPYQVDPLFLKIGATFTSAPECPPVFVLMGTGFFVGDTCFGSTKDKGFPPGAMTRGHPMKPLWCLGGCRSIPGRCHRTHTHQDLQPQAAFAAKLAAAACMQRLKVLRYLASLWRGRCGPITSGRKKS